MLTIKEHWENYREQVVPKKAGEEQLNQLKQAFYSGFFTNGELQKYLVSKYTEDIYAEIMTNIEIEFHQYAEERLKGG